MRVLCIGDQHFTAENVEESEHFISQLQNYLENNKVDIIVSMGDLLDRHGMLHTLTLKRAKRYLHLLKQYAKTYVLVGNHDMINSNQYLNENNWLYVLKDCFSNLIIVDKVISENITVDDIEKRFIFCPFIPDGRFIEGLNTVYNWKSSDTIFAHQTVDGVKFNGITVENTDEWLEHFPLCVSGHIHTPTKLFQNFIYTGDAFQNENCRLLLLTYGNNNVKQENVILNLIKHTTRTINIDQINDVIIKENEKLKLRIECTETQFKTFKKSDKYNELKLKGIKMDPIININNKVEYTNDENESFTSILENNLQKKPDIYKLYREIVYDELVL